MDDMELRYAVINRVWVICYKVSSNIAGPILGLRQASERRRYFVTTSLMGLVQA